MSMLEFAFLLLNQDLPDPLEAGWQGEPVCELLHENEQLRTLRCTFPPGVGHEQHRHAPHWGYVLQGGEQRIIDANGTRTITVGTDGHWWSDGTIHEVLNVGDTTTQYLIIEPKEQTEENAEN